MALTLAMADGAMGYMFMGFAVVCLMAIAAFTVWGICTVWASFILAISAKSRRRRKWIIAFAPLAMFYGYCGYCLITRAPYKWVTEMVSETEPPIETPREF